MTDNIVYRGEARFTPEAPSPYPDMRMTYGTYRDVQVEPLPWYAGHDFVDLWCYVWGVLGAILTASFVAYHGLKFLKGVC